MLEWMNIFLLKCISVELQLGLARQHMYTESGKKVAIGWCCASLGYHSKVTLRSSQGHCKVKLAKNMIFRIFLSIPNPFGVQVSITNDCCWHIIGRVPFHRASQGVCMQFPWGGGGDYHLGFPLITPLSQSWSESTKVLKCNSVEPQLEPPWQHKYGYRIGSPRIARDLYAISALGGDYHLGIPLITPLSQRYSESTQLLKFSSVEHQLHLAWQHMDTELGMKDYMGWCCAILGYHLKVSSRSSQGHCKVKLEKHDFLCFYLFQTHLGCWWLIKMTAVDTFLIGYHFFTTHRKYAI